MRLENNMEKNGYIHIPAGVKEVTWRGGRNPFRMLNLLWLLMDLKQVIKRIQPDIIHAGPLQTSAFLAALSGHPRLVGMSWGSDLLVESERNGLLRTITKYVLGHTSVLACDCQAVKDKAVDMGFPSDRAVVFPWGVDLNRFSPKVGGRFRKEMGWDKAFVILCLRAMEPLYGVDVVMRGFQVATRTSKDLRLILLGSGSLKGEIQKMVRDAGLESSVYFGGTLKNEELVDFYHSADLYVSASRSDGSSVSLMEAMACGLPALVSDIPGNREWITPGKNGWFFPVGDVDGLAGGILSAYLRRNELSEMQKNARRIAEQKADWEKNFQELQRGYQMAMTG